LSASDYVLSAPQLNSAFFLAAPIDGCNGTSGKGSIAPSLLESTTSQARLQAYPNPSQTQWQILYASNQQESLLFRLYSMDGRMLWQGILQPPYIVPAEQWPQGLYQLHVSSASWHETLKVMKQ
ncbi:MAG: T9SS type A sorting domain-containing protein, partial [Chitinophagaceae bacterium]|nr:T9SS type A sorting domain-containing protein [Chitinophagaceae bacterium]